MAPGFARLKPSRYIGRIRSDEAFALHQPGFRSAKAFALQEPVALA
jgi:hypothetical protein